MNIGYITTETPEQLEYILVHDLLDENQRMWDIEVVPDLFNERDKQLILQIPLPIRVKEVSWYWMLEIKRISRLKAATEEFKGNLHVLISDFGRNYGI